MNHNRYSCSSRHLASRRLSQAISMLNRVGYQMRVPVDLHQTFTAIGFAPFARGLRDLTIPLFQSQEVR